MLAYLIKRLGVAILVALTVSVITFSMIYLSGDPAVALAGESATEEDIENIRRFYGYDRPIAVQYVNWLGRAVQGDFGQSHYLREPVAVAIFERLPTTMLLGLCALVFALTLSVPLGVLAAIRPNSLIDRAALTLAVVGQAMPSFWFALTLMLWLGIYWRAPPDHGERLLGELRDAVHRARVLRHPGGDAAHPGGDARGASGGLHPHRPRQGAAADAGPVQACAAQRHHPRRLPRRGAVRVHARRLESSSRRSSRSTASASSRGNRSSGRTCR